MSKNKDNRTKKDFPKDKNGRTILGTALDMSRWVELGFEEQRKENPEIYAFQGPYIDLSNCDLFVSYPIGAKTTTSTIFNLCDIAGIVSGITKDEFLENDYFYVVDKNITFENSILRGVFLVMYTSKAI